MLSMLGSCRACCCGLPHTGEMPALIPPSTCPVTGLRDWLLYTWPCSEHGRSNYWRTLHVRAKVTLRSCSQGAL